MISLKKFVIFGLISCLLFPASSVYGHGFGLDTISSIDIQGKKLSISVEMPMTFENDQEQITIHGEQDSLLGAWYGTESNPLEITGPLFDSSGLYNFEIEIRTIDEPTNIIESRMYNADLSVIETVSFTQKDSKNNDVDFRSKSYFDTISNFNYDYEANQVTFEMPFDWSEKQMSHVSVVHVETHFPKEFVEFLAPSYSGYVNGIELFKSSVSVDDYTEDDERIVHFVLLQDHLRYLKNEMKKDLNEFPKNMIFTISMSTDKAFPLEAYTKSEDFKINLSWDPMVVEPGVATNFIFTIRDGRTNEPLRSSDYTFVIIQNGKEIYRISGLAQIGGEFEKFTFTEDQTGPTIIKFENIRNTGQETEFVLVVVPEFGTIALLILVISTMSIIFISRKNQLFI